MSSFQVDQARGAAVAANGGQDVNSQQVAEYAEYYTNHGAALRIQHQADVHQHQEQQQIDVVNTPPSNTLSYNVEEHEYYGQQGGLGVILMEAARTATPPSNNQPIRTPTPNSSTMVAYMTNQVQDRRLQQQQHQNLTPQEIANLFSTPATN